MNPFPHASFVWRRLFFPVSLTSCLGILLLALVLQPSAAASSANACSIPYQPGNGWAIELCPTEPSVPITATVVLDGVNQGAAAYLVIYHDAANDPGTPQVLVLYASGYLRLKPNVNPTPANPFGGSFVLGPAYWSSDDIYHHNPQLSQIALDTTGLPEGPLRLTLTGTNGAFNIYYDLLLPPPTDQQTRLHVNQIYTATAPITVDLARHAQHEGFKLAQVSTMYINEGGTCDGGESDCHDSNASRFIGADLVRHQIAFTETVAPAFLFNPPIPLSSPWLDILHTDDASWQGNTPNLRLALDVLPTSHTITPQGWITNTSHPHDDNVGLWLHEDATSNLVWAVGESGQVGYWLLAQDNPPEPWLELGLRTGFTFLDFETTYDCYFVHDGNQPTNGFVQPIPGYNDTALQMAYNLGYGDGHWTQIRCDFSPLDLSDYDHFRFDWLGDPEAANSLEIGFINPAGSQENIFGRAYGHVTHHSWWGQMVVPFSFLHPWTSGTTFNPGQVSSIFFSVVQTSAVGDEGGIGHLAIDNLNVYNVAERPVPGSFTPVMNHPLAAQSAAAWLTSQQQANGLLKSWAEEGTCYSYIYDQALALLVFTHAGQWAEAEALVQALNTSQNSDGSWYQRYDCQSGTPADPTYKWEGDIAWAVYALGRYLTLGGTNGEATNTRDNAAAWLSRRLDESTGCLVFEHAEATLDVWWALQSAGVEYVAAANGLHHCLVTVYWDETMGRFKGGLDWWQPLLDNQTWGAAFWRALGEEEKALRALSYARHIFLLPAQNSQLFGLDGQAGPWSVWNEGTAQYIAVGGPDAPDLLAELLAQQQPDGSMPGSPDDFSGGGVWTSRWHGVSATAWLYLALYQNPFQPVPYSQQYLPFMVRP